MSNRSQRVQGRSNRPTPVFSFRWRRLVYDCDKWYSPNGKKQYLRCLSCRNQTCAGFSNKGHSAAGRWSNMQFALRQSLFPVSKCFPVMTGNKYFNTCCPTENFRKDFSWSALRFFTWRRQPPEAKHDCRFRDPEGFWPCTGKTHVVKDHFHQQPKQTQCGDPKQEVK